MKLHHSIKSGTLFVFLCRSSNKNKSIVKIDSAYMTSIIMCNSSSIRKTNICELNFEFNTLGQMTKKVFIFLTHKVNVISRKIESIAQFIFNWKQIIRRMFALQHTIHTVIAHMKKNNDNNNNNKKRVGHAWDSQLEVFER